MMDRFWEKYREHRLLLGTHINSADPQLTEMIGNFGFDYLWIDMEHSTLNTNLVLQHLIAARAAQVPAFVRIPWNDAVLAKPVLEMGVQGIIFPMVSSAEQAEYAVRACLYPPDGIRGFGPRRAIRYGLDPVMDYIHTESKKILKLIMIETREAVENIDEIARVEGVDVLVVGPCDLSGAYGKLNQLTDPEIRSIYRHVVDRVHAAGKPALVSNSPYAYENIKNWVDLGFDMITSGSDVNYVFNGAKEVMETAKSIFSAVGRL